MGRDRKRTKKEEKKKKEEEEEEVQNLKKKEFTLVRVQTKGPDPLSD